MGAISAARTRVRSVQSAPDRVKEPRAKKSASASSKARLLALPDLSKPQLLRRFLLLETLSDEELKQIGPLLAPRTLRAGDLFDAEDFGKPGVGFLWSGRCRIAILSRGDRYATIRNIRPGWHFGEIAILAEASHSPYSLVIDEDCLIFQLPAQAFRDLMRAIPALNEAVMRHLARTAMARADRIYEFALLDGDIRLQAELLRLAQHGRKVGGAVIISGTHDGLGAQIGMTREGVSRHLKFLAQQDLVATKRSEITILDAKRIEANVARATSRALSYRGDGKDWE